MRIFRKFKLQQICKAVILGLTALLCAALHADDVKRLSIAPLENKSRYRDVRDNMIGDRFAETLTSKVMENKHCEIVDRSHLEKVMKQQALDLSGLVDPSTAAKVGKILGVSHLVIGSIHEVSAVSSSPILSRGGLGLGMVTCRVNLNVKMINVQTAKIELSKEVKVTKRIPALQGGLEGLTSNDYSTAASEALYKIAIEIWKAIPVPMPPIVSPQYVVLEVDPKTKEVFLDIEGSEFDVKKGQKFDVFRAGGFVRNKEGDIKGQKKIPIGEVKITSVEDSMACCKITHIEKDPETKEKHEIRQEDFARAKKGIFDKAKETIGD